MMKMREVAVIPGEEIVIFPFEGKNSKVRMTIYPERQLLSAPAVHEISHSEFEQYFLALERAQVLLNWYNVKAIGPSIRREIREEDKRRRDGPGFNVNA
jgi:hypothetical protein